MHAKQQENVLRVHDRTHFLSTQMQIV